MTKKPKIKTYEPHQVPNPNSLRIEIVEPGNVHWDLPYFMMYATKRMKTGIYKPEVFLTNNDAESFTYQIIFLAKRYKNFAIYTESDIILQTIQWNCRHQEGYFNHWKVQNTYLDQVGCYVIQYDDMGNKSGAPAHYHREAMRRTDLLLGRDKKKKSPLLPFRKQWDNLNIK